MVRARKIFSKEFKLRVMQELDAGATVAELARRHEVHPRLIYNWYMAYKKNPVGAFDSTSRRQVNQDPSVARIAELERKVGQLAMENDFLKKVLQRVEATFGPSPPKRGTI
jgi:transposase-like protein